jgi:hypothetical protein
MVVKITPKEYEPFKMDWLEGISNGMMAEWYGITQKRIPCIARKLCNLDIITEQEFEECKARRISSTIHERNVKVKSNDFRQFADMLLAGTSTSDIATKYSMSRSNVKAVFRRIIDSKVIDEDEIDKIRSVRKADLKISVSKRRSLQYESKIRSLLKALLVDKTLFEDVVETFGTNRKFYKKAFNYAVRKKIAVQGIIADSTLFDMFDDYKERAWKETVQRMRNTGVYERATRNATKYGAQDPLYLGNIKFRSKGEGFLGLMLMKFGIVDELRKGKNFQVSYDGLRLDFLVDGHDIEYHPWPINHKGLQGRTLGSWIKNRKETIQESFVTNVDCNGKILLVTASINDNKLLMNQSYLVFKRLDPTIEKEYFNKVYYDVKNNMENLLSKEPPKIPEEEAAF